jgi:hypothetical protein
MFRRSNVRVTVALLGAIACFVISVPNYSLSDDYSDKGTVAIEKGKTFYYERKFKEAKKNLILQAEDGNIEAQYYLALVYMAQKDFSRAIIWFEKSGNGGNHSAYFQIGVMYDNGLGVPKNPLNAKDWYRKSRLAEAKNRSEYENEVYEMVDSERLKKTTMLAMVEKLKGRAQNGDPDAQFKFAQQLDFGMFVPRDLESAITWYLKAAQNAQEDAQFTLGYFYCRGVGVKQNKKIANEWLLKSGRPVRCD